MTVVIVHSQSHKHDTQCLNASEIDGIAITKPSIAMCHYISQVTSRVQTDLYLILPYFTMTWHKAGQIDNASASNVVLLKFDSYL